MERKGKKKNATIYIDQDDVVLMKRKNKNKNFDSEGTSRFVGMTVGSPDPSLV